MKPMKTEIINLTPHAITVAGTTINPSGTVARVSQSLYQCGEANGIPLYTGSYGETTDLPEETEALIIVSAMVRIANPSRRDLASPAKFIRDEAGNITGCEGLEVNP